MIEIIFPDGTKKKYFKGVKPIEIANDISPSLYKNALSASLNNSVIELNSSLNEGGEFKVFTWKDNEGKKAFWHSSAHVLAQSIKHIYPKAKLTIGPAIDKAGIAINGDRPIATFFLLSFILSCNALFPGSVGSY